MAEELVIKWLREFWDRSLCVLMRIRDVCVHGFKCHRREEVKTLTTNPSTYLVIIIRGMAIHVDS
jgi:hypothetical protein